MQKQFEKDSHDPDKSIAQLKREFGFPENDNLVYHDDGQNVVLSDKDQVRHIPDGAQIASTLGEGDLMG